jgi:hypothetical protein
LKTVNLVSPFQQPKNEISSVFSLSAMSFLFAEASECSILKEKSSDGGVEISVVLGEIFDGS